MQIYYLCKCINNNSIKLMLQFRSYWSSYKGLTEDT